MNKNLKLITSILATFIFLLISLDIAEATVGGPTYIHNFKYNPQNESVYYIENDNGGRGCPPVLESISLATSKNQIIYSCEQGEKILYSEKDYNTAILQISNKINDIISDFKDLTPINLRKNNISIDLQFVKSEKLSPEIDEIKNSIFSATIYQNSKKITEISLSGCNIDQPFTFAGYTVPGFEKKIVLLLSTKGNCFEGGYINESLLVLGGLDYVNKDYLNFYKGPTALVPNEGTLTVYEYDNIVVNGLAQLPIEQKEITTKSKSNLALIALASLVVGFLLGRIRKQSQDPIA